MRRRRFLQDVVAGGGLLISRPTLSPEAEEIRLPVADEQSAPDKIKRVLVMFKCHF
ncbi:MAG: hypothetical protein ACLQOO_32680 [Terriglobia bacterium]